MVRARRIFMDCLAIMYLNGTGNRFAGTSYLYARTQSQFFIFLRFLYQIDNFDFAYCTKIRQHWKFVIYNDGLFCNTKSNCCRSLFRCYIREDDRVTELLKVISRKWGRGSGTNWLWGGGGGGCTTTNISTNPFVFSALVSKPAY